jgi:hypothetical protein
MQIGGYVAFTLFIEEFDPDGASDALRRAGFNVTRMPLRWRERMTFPEDEFILVTIEGSDDRKIIRAVMDEINTIVRPFGGDLDECGPIHGVPFEVLFKEPSHPKKEAA